MTKTSISEILSCINKSNSLWLLGNQFHFYGEAVNYCIKNNKSLSEIEVIFHWNGSILYYAVIEERIKADFIYPMKKKLSNK